MKINDFPRDSFQNDSEKLEALYKWCYELSLYIGGGVKNEQASSEGK